MSGSLLKSASVVGGMTFLSRVLGFVRDVLTATLFGAGAAMDAFFVAFRIPNLFRRLFAEGAFSQAFVPVLSEAKAQRSPEEVRKLIDAVAGSLAAVLGLITAAAILGAPLLMGLFAPGFADDPAKFGLGVELLRWTFPYLLLISLTAFLAGILNTYGVFAAPAFNPVWLNVCLIAAAWFYAPSVEALAIGVFAGGVIQLAFLLPAVARLGLLPRPTWGFGDPQVRRIMLLMLPIMFGSSVSQISLLVDSIIASFLPGDGNVAWLWYADRLMEFPLGIFSVAIATVILPSLARQHARGASENYSAMIDWGLRLVLLIGIPAALGLFLLAGPLVSTLFQHAAFTVRDVHMTGWALMAYAFGFLGFSLVKVLVPGFYARQETRAPVRYGVISLIVAMISSVSLSFAAVRTGFVAPHAAIALSTALGAWINALLLLAGLRRRGIYRPAPGWGRFALQVGLANAAMAAVLAAFAGPLEQWTGAPAFDRLLHLSWLMAAAVAVYGAGLALTGVRPRHFRQSAH